ncbi:hypothetical protein [Brevundimonas sp.]|uniref:hypothetical protein n=1 Tax=Brevundimonas sp. TaxID=1871086 RepID=UPI00286CF91F|nr:hypothetical protein [Brevundimonas sp.]
MNFDRPALPAISTMILAAFLSTSLSGCVTGVVMAAASLDRARQERQAQRLSQPAPGEYAWATAPGVQVTGVFRLSTPKARPVPGGVQNGPREVLTCEGHRVRLIPDTPHSRFVLADNFELQVAPGGFWRNGFVALEWEWPSVSASVVRETRCTTDGAFTFDNVPDGEWLIMAEINPPSYDGGESVTDTVLRAVTIQGRSRPVHLDIQIGGKDDVNGVIQRF